EESRTAVPRRWTRCPSCRTVFRQIDGIWRFLMPEQLDTYRQFLHEYGIVRTDEGWGADDPFYYRALPYVPTEHPQCELWRIRTRSFEAFLRHVLTPAESEKGKPLTILDLGAGNGWLAHRLA